MRRGSFIELHYLQSGDPVLINVEAISRVYSQHETKETRVALLEDKNGSVDATLCSRAAVYRVKETYEEVKEMIKAAQEVKTWNECLADLNKRGILSDHNTYLLRD